MQRRNKTTLLKLLCLIPEVACICSCESIDVQTDVSHGKIEHEEVTGIPHLLHCEERHDADGIEEESEHTCRWKTKEVKCTFIFSVVSP